MRGDMFCFDMARENPCHASRLGSFVFRIGGIMKKLTVALAFAGLAVLTVPASVALAADPVPETLAELTPEQRQQLLDFEASLHPQGGVVQVPGGHATLNLGDQYYFLPADEAQKVLANWGNDPSTLSDVLGIVFPKGKHSYDDTWGAVITYVDTGHVEDKDAADQDYGQVLTDMKSGEEAANEASRKAGYAGSVTVGWAQPPSYDSAGKTLIWARNLKFDGAKVNTLNYDVRKLGRTGVLSMNMVDSLPNLANVRTAAVDLGNTVQFDSGMAYDDFNSATDHTADYGLAGLVAAGAGVAVAKKVGILGIVLLFLKKGIIVVLAALAGGWAWVKRKLGFGGAAEADVYESSEPVDGEGDDTGKPG